MPSHKIHTSIAIEVNKILNKNEDMLKLGSVLPDLTISHDHGLSHFQLDYEYPKNLANADEFIKKYPDYKDDISIGYIIHLLTDRFYNDTFYHSNIEGIEYNRKFKHKLFDTYDELLLKHNKVSKFNNKDIINEIPDYKDLSFDKEYLNVYIDNYNNDIENTIIDNNYNVKFNDFLDELYYGCIEYIIKNINNFL